MNNPNILFITIDALRADKCYGTNKTSKTPNLDSLIDKGIYFSQAICTADQTGNSLLSMFTGNFPIKSGKTQFNMTIDNFTYFDILKKNGYETDCFVPDIDFFQKLTSKFDSKTLYIFEKRESWQRLDGGLGDQIVEKLKAKKTKEHWIFYIHLMDIRKPFTTPPEFDKEEYGNTKYDRLVSSIDAWLGKFLNEINLNNTLLILTSDHGEYIPVTGDDITEIPKIQNMVRKGRQKIPFAERLLLKSLINLRFIVQTYRKEKLKRTLSPYEMRSFNTRSALDLYDETIRVPLIFVGNNIHSHKVIPDLVRHVDVFPTIADLIGLSCQESDLNGRSLLPLINDKKLPELPAYIEVGVNLAQLIDKKNPNTLGKIIGLRTSEYKYLRSRDDQTQNRRLYDLKNDPKEENNIAHSKPDVINDMEQKLTELMEESNLDASDKITDEEIKRAKDILTKVGYI